MLLSAYYVSGTVQGSQTLVIKTSKGPVLRRCICFVPPLCPKPKPGPNHDMR